MITYFYISLILKKQVKCLGKIGWKDFYCKKAKDYDWMLENEMVVAVSHKFKLLIVRYTIWRVK